MRGRVGLLAHSVFSLLVVLVALWDRWDARSAVPALEPSPLIACEQVERLSAVLETPTGEYQLLARKLPDRRRQVRIRRQPRPPASASATAGLTELPGYRSHPELIDMVLSLPEKERFAANAAAERWAELVARLPVAHRLAPVAAERLREFGFSASSWWLSVDCAGRTTRIQVGDEAYGLGLRYARRDGRGPIVLLPSKVFADLQSARFRLMENRLAAVPLDKVTSVLLGVGSQQVRVERAAEGIFRAAGGPLLPDFGPFIKRLANLPVVSYLGPGQVPETLRVGSKTALEVELLVDSSELVHIRLHMQQIASAPEFYGWSDNTGAWVKLYGAAAASVWRAAAAWPDALPAPHQPQVGVEAE